MALKLDEALKPHDELGLRNKWNSEDASLKQLLWVIDSWKLLAKESLKA
jgi:hypothetical protein